MLIVIHESQEKKYRDPIFKLEERNTEERVRDPRGYPTRSRTVAWLTQNVAIRTSKRWKAEQWTGSTHRSVQASVTRHPESHT